MRVISKRTFREFRDEHPETEQSLKAWHHLAKAAKWKTSQDVLVSCPTARPIGGARVVFNIKGNDYRLVVMIHYESGQIFNRFVGTHAEYDKIDSLTI